jgi:hypothetical protein
MKTKTHFAFRVDIWDAAANSIVEHVAGVDENEGPTGPSGFGTRTTGGGKHVARGSLWKRFDVTAQ